MRSSILTLTLGLVVPGLIGCGDDDNIRPVDGPVVDSMPDSGGPPFKEYDANEGGEVRVEYVRFPNSATGNAATRVTAFLYKDPGTTDFFPYLSLNGCTDTSTKMHWPVATNPIAERQYMDPGTVIIAGGPQVLGIPRRATEGTDPFGRTHPANSWNFHFGGGMATDGPTYVPEKTKLDVIFTGSADMPAQVYDDVLFVPADFTQISPATGPGTGPHPIPAGTAQTFTWNVTQSNPPAGYEVLSLVAFTGAKGPVVICVEPNDGSITVPANLIDVARAQYPMGGTLARQTLTHVVRELKDKNGPTGRRIDFISVWCDATSFSVP